MGANGGAERPAAPRALAAWPCSGSQQLLRLGDVLAPGRLLRHSPGAGRARAHLLGCGVGVAPALLPPRGPLSGPSQEKRVLGALRTGPGAGPRPRKAPGAAPSPRPGLRPREHGRRGLSAAPRLPAGLGARGWRPSRRSSLWAPGPSRTPGEQQGGGGRGAGVGVSHSPTPFREGRSGRPADPSALRVKEKTNMYPTR